jgi:hypothetical protein
MHKRQRSSRSKRPIYLESEAPRSLGQWIFKILPPDDFHALSNMNNEALL